MATIDGHPRRHGDFVVLAPGRHAMFGDAAVRLRLIPVDVEKQIDPRFLAEQALFPSVYDY